MTFNPPANPHCLYYLPAVADEPDAYWDGVAGTGTHPDADTELVGTIDNTGISGVSFNAASTGVRPALKDLGGGLLAVQGASGKAMRHNNAAYANTIHESREVWFYIVFQMDANVTSGSRAIFDNTNMTTDASAGSQGFTLQTQNQPSGNAISGWPAPSNTVCPKVRIKNASGLVIAMYAEDSLTESSPTPHVFRGRIQPTGLCEFQVDNGRKTYGLVTGASGSGNAPFGMFILNRASLGLEFPGAIITAGIYSQYPGEDEEQSWLDKFPLGSIAGSPEIRVGQFHYNLAKPMQYMPFCIFFNGQRISAGGDGTTEQGEVAVFNDGVSTDSGWVGGPHGSYTLTGATVQRSSGPPVAIEDGGYYEDDSQVIETREYDMGVSFTNVETVTLKSNSRRYHTRMVRLGDSRTISTSFYLQRHNRAASYNNFMFFDANGEVLDSGTGTIGVEEAGPAGTIAAAQWSSSTQVLILAIMTIEPFVTPEFLILPEGTGCRLYIQTPDARLMEEDDVIEMEMLTKYYSEVDSESWEAKAQSEMLRFLGIGTLKRRSNALAHRLGF